MLPFVSILLTAITIGTSKLIKYKYCKDIQYNQMMKLKMYLNKDCDALRGEMHHRADEMKQSTDLRIVQHFEQQLSAKMAQYNL
ncbi:hypothetical protein KHM83_06610 [Fusibacter paucivorans]|uniref:Uncharacterized protein n=1 Tax=Fusibacter paucivorans TaxID=76009 RepID=A0ABS5PMD8_9FIRM|nr:hypothetical protein [Fusibacter paucivorans]